MREITPDVEALHMIIGVGNLEDTGSTGSNTYNLAFRIVDSEWLTEHDRAVAERSFDEGVKAKSDSNSLFDRDVYATNPYRKES